MSRSNTLYIFIVLLMAIPFIGIIFIKDAFWIYSICALLAVILFLIRIARGDD